MGRPEFIQWMEESPGEYWMVFALVVFLAIAGFIKAFKGLHRKRIIQDTPTSKIRSATQGYIELIGRSKLMEGPPIVAPLTGKPCVWYKYAIDEARGHAKGWSWRTIEDRESEELFLLEDDTGGCVIDPEGADVTTTVKQVWYGKERRPGAYSAPKRFSGIYMRRFRYTEYRLNTGDVLYAIGLFKTSGGAGGKLNVSQDMAELIREWKADSQELLTRFDTNKDGQIDMKEWQAVREEAYKQIMLKHKELKTQPALNIMGQTMDTRRPFLLSMLPQSKLVKRIHYHATAWIIVFFAAGIAATWLIGLKAGS